MSQIHWKRGLRLAPFLVAGYALTGRTIFAADLAEPVTRYVELKDATLKTKGEKGVQIIELPSGDFVRVEIEHLQVRDRQIFVEEAALTELALDAQHLGQRLEVHRSEPVRVFEDGGSVGAIASTLGSIIGTFALVNTMEDLTSDMLSLSSEQSGSTSTASTASSASTEAQEDPALDAEEDEAAEASDDSEETEDDQEAPQFATAPVDGRASESAAEGTSTGAQVKATDSDGDTLVYSIETQDVEGAFSVDKTTGEILVANSKVIDFEQQETLNLKVTVSDGQGGTDSQVVTITITDDDRDTLSQEASLWRAHGALSSGAIGLGNASTDPELMDGRFFVTGVEAASGLAYIHQYSGIMDHLHSGPDMALHSATAEGFGALEEINYASLSGGFLYLSGYADPSIKALSLAATATDFSTAEAFDALKHYRTFHADASGKAAERYAFEGGTIEQTDPSLFSTTDPAFDIDTGDILSFGDLTGDGRAEAIVLKAGMTEAQVFENLGTAFATSPLEETILTGVDLDARAGGQLLDLSISDHLSNGSLNAVLLGETGLYFYELT